MNGLVFASMLAGFSLGLASAAAAQDRFVTGGRIMVPDSSVERPADRGIRAHTNVELFYPTDGLPMTAANTPGGYFETPASLACVYKQVAVVTGCSPAVVTAVSRRGSRAIAIVDAYDDPNAFSDLTAYSAEFGLPKPTKANFEVVYATPGGSTTTTTPPPPGFERRLGARGIGRHRIGACHGAESQNLFGGGQFQWLGRHVAGRDPGQQSGGGSRRRRGDDELGVRRF